jgi:hypothetical protein
MTLRISWDPGLNEVSPAALFIWQMDVETEAIATTATKNMIPLAPRHIAHLKVSWREVSKMLAD